MLFIFDCLIGSLAPVLERWDILLIPTFMTACMLFVSFQSFKRTVLTRTKPVKNFGL